MNLLAITMLGVLTAADPISLSFEKGRLTASVQNSPIRLFLEQLSLKTQVAIIPGDEIGDDSVSVELTGMLLDEALRAVFSGYDTFFYYQAQSLRSVWVYPKGTAATLRPVPPQVWAGARELEASLADSDSKVREQAYQSLLGRPDSRSRDHIVQALRGREKEEPVRQRILSDVISKGIELPPDLLVELARVDPSEQIRWMALDALSESTSARQVAEALLTDPSESVRQRASEIITELNAAAERLKANAHP